MSTRTGGRASRSRQTVAASLAALAFFALPVAAQAAELKLLASDGAAGVGFATTVAVDGDTAVVGAPNDSDSEGAAYVFTRSGDGWTQTGKLTASGGGPFDRLGGSVAIDGDTIVAGAAGAGVGGAVYTFARTGPAERTQTATLTATDAETDDDLGRSVAIDGDTIVGGAPFVDIEGNTAEGAVYTFARTGPAERTQTARLTAAAGGEGDQLGISVGIDGDTIVAGAPDYEVGATDGGAAYTFARTGPAERTQTARLIAIAAHEGDYLGRSVAIDGDTIAAGAPYHQIGGTGTGAVYTFARTGNGMLRYETAELTAADGAANWLGGSVAIDGDTIVAGMPFHDIGPNTNQGAVLTFASTGADHRTETAKLTDADGEAQDEFGDAVAISGDTIIAGSPLDDVGTEEDQGSATIFFASDEAADYADVVHSDDPVGYWRFGDQAGTLLNDSSPYGNDGEYLGGVTLKVPGALVNDADTAASFDGIDDSGRVADAASLDVGASFTAEGWIKRSSTAKSHSMMIKAGKGLQLMVMNAGSGSQVWLRKANVTTIARSSMGVPADGKYHHIVATVDDANQARIYIDGIQDTVAVSPAKVENTAFALTFGSGASTTASFDEFALYDRALSGAEVLEHTAAGNGTVVCPNC